MKSLKPLDFFGLLFSLLLVLLSGCNDSTTSSNSPVESAPLEFNHTSITVTNGSKRELILTLNESGVSGLHVSINTTESSIATVSPGECVLSSGPDGAPSSCKVFVTGHNDGTADITATATGYTVTPVLTTVQDAPVAGTLSFSQTTQTVTNGSTNYVLLSLNDSSGISDLVVTLGSTASGVASPKKSTCTLSSGESHVCEVVIDGNSIGNAYITAQATNYESPTPVYVTVTSSTVPGTIAFNTTHVEVSPTTSTQVTLSLLNSSGIVNQAVTLGSTSANATESPISCTLSSGDSTDRSCIVTIKGAISGTAQITAISTGYTISPVNVVIESATSFSRTFTIYNNSNAAIWLGSIGGATLSIKDGVSSGSDLCGESNPGAVCPSGTTCTDVGLGGQKCFFNPLTSSSGTTFKIESGTTLIVGVPKTSYDPANDFVWSGNMFARQQCNESTGVCVVANCTTVNGGTDMTCTTSAQPPVSLAEITMLRKNPDSYDISLENGFNTAVKFAPNNTTYSSTQTPYNCGTAGATESITSAGFTIPSSSWHFTPSGYQQGSPQPTANNFYWVSGDGSTSSCGGNESCSNGQVCGYTTNAVTSVSGLAPTQNYKLTCGTLLGYFSAAELWFLNESTTNVAPFNFSGFNGSSTYNNATLFACSTPPLYTGNESVAGQNQNNTCGSTMWNGIAAPAYSYAITNPNWESVVLTNITWTKQGCPSCYTYPYDDASSSYTCDNVTAGSDNPPNSTNYNVIFSNFQ